MKLYSASNIVKLMHRQSFADWYEHRFIPALEGREGFEDIDLEAEFENMLVGKGIEVEAA